MKVLTNMKSNIFISFLLYVLIVRKATILTEKAPPKSVSSNVRVYRLPENTEPVSYKLRVKPIVDLINNNYTFYGQVDIVIRVKQYTDEIVLNSKGLNVSSVSGLEDWKTKRVTAVKNYVCNENDEQLVIKLEKSILPPRNYSFSVVFQGILRNDFTGFHKYFYDSRNNSRWIALTQFKPTYARRAFPCYDEPKFKSPYQISISRQSKHFALSNMPLKHSELDSQNGWSWDHFETTKPIPTYLVAFMVSDFDKKSLNNEHIAMYTRKEFIDNTTFMMGKAPNLLGVVEKFTQIPYMLPKLDLVGVPLLDAYNMENWGLNSHKEFYLTLSNNSPTKDKLLGTMTVLHEILHQWFGNMVTTPRWDYIWLNEGICNYLKYLIMDEIEPGWGLEEKFIEDVHQRALAWDGYDANETHPLTFPVHTPNEIINSFDAITLDKSAALFRMLKYMVGETNFKKSLNKYLNDFAYNGAGPTELWQTFDYVLFDSNYIIDEDIIVNNTMYLWTEQSGYPLINISEINGSIIATQERFSLSNPRENDNTKWFVGLTYTTEKTKRFDSLTPTVWLKPTEEKTVLSVPPNSGWIICNLQSSGFYRVNYDEKNWKLLLIQLNTKPDQIHFLNRAQIIDDAHYLSRAKIVPYKYYTSLLEYLLMENHVTPWNTAMNGLASIMDGIQQYPKESSQFKEYTKKLSDIFYNKFTRNEIKNESTKNDLSKLVTWSCKFGNSRCEESALRHFNAWTNGHDVPSEMEEAAFCIGMKKGNFTTWSKMYTFYRTTRSESRKQIALRALACIENVTTLFNYLNLVRLDDTKQTSVQNLKSACENIVTTPHGVKALTWFLSRKLDAILALQDGQRLVRHAYSALASRVVTDKEIAMMNEIRQSVKLAALRTTFDEKYRQAESNLLWMERDHEKIVEALGKR